MRKCRVIDLFEVEYGCNMELNALEIDPNGINFVSRTSKNNGVSARVKLVPGIKPIPGGTLSVACGGSVMETFLQSSPYYSGRDLYYLTPKINMSNEMLLYYAMCLRGNKFKFSYGRQANVSLPDLPIPCIESIPDYVSLMSVSDYGRKLLKTICFDNIKCPYPKKSEPELVRLDQLFDDKPGIASSSVIRSNEKLSDNWIPYIRPSYRQETCIDAYVNRGLIPSNKIFSSETIYVSTDGQGSHTYSYVSTFEFVPNSNVTVLIPKRPMSLQEKLYYSQCITKNRYKFSYGRKPKGERLKELLLPKFPPSYVINFNIESTIDNFLKILDNESQVTIKQ